VEDASRTAWDTGPGNRLYEALLRERPAIASRTEIVRLPAATELATEGRAARFVYFPCDGVASVVIRLAEGGTSEVLTVGREGMVGISVWLGLARSLETVEQLRAGTMLRIRGDRFCQAISGSRRARELLHHYTAYALRASAQTVACGAVHPVEQRLCRWLLATADRTGVRELAISQAALGAALSVRRQTVGEVALRLQHDGLIAYRRGVVRIVDPAGVEARACECYRTLRDLYRQVVVPRLGR
jgi:CRP-like cAMP-binding protein